MQLLIYAYMFQLANNIPKKTKSWQSKNYK